MRIDYLGLEAFVAIAEHGSFQRAALALALSQTALSHRLRKVEADVGTPLLLRSSREVSLTDAGQNLLPDARRLLKELSDSYAAVRDRARRRRRVLSFACLPTIAHTRLPSILSAFAADHPEAGFELHEIPASGIATLVTSGVAEFGLTIVSAQLPDLRVRALFEEPYAVLMRADHPLAHLDALARDDLNGTPMVRISTQSKNRQLVEDGLALGGTPVDWRYVVQNATMAMAMVSEGMGFTILPLGAAAYAPPGLAARPFSDVRIARTIGLVTRRGVPVSHLGQALMQVLETRLSGDVTHRSEAD